MSIPADRAAALLQELEGLGSAHNRRVYARHGVGEPLLGVAYGNLRPLVRRLGRDQTLARALWETHVHEARLLACLISDPSALADTDAEQWIDDCHNHVLTDEVCGAVSRTTFADRLALTWAVHPAEWRSRAGWGLICHLASRLDDIDDAWLAPFIDHVVVALPGAHNRARHAMNAALIAIGGYRPRLRPAALGAARAIGEVIVDHGRTGCVTPDAAAYIAKMAAREVDRPKPARKKRKAAKQKARR
jgi:3-methyladenine DNA glycosylase AlkD